MSASRSHNHGTEPRPLRWRWGSRPTLPTCSRSAGRTARRAVASLEPALSPTRGAARAMTGSMACRAPPEIAVEPPHASTMERAPALRSSTLASGGSAGPASSRSAASKSCPAVRSSPFSASSAQPALATTPAPPGRPAGDHRARCSTRWLDRSIADLAHADDRDADRPLSLCRRALVFAPPSAATASSRR